MHAHNTHACAHEHTHAHTAYTDIQSPPKKETEETQQLSEEAKKSKSDQVPTSVRLFVDVISPPFFWALFRLSFSLLD